MADLAGYLIFASHGINTMAKETYRSRDGESAPSLSGNVREFCIQVIL